jgi:hypothetical protein
MHCEILAHWKYWRLQGGRMSEEVTVRLEGGDSHAPAKARLVLVRSHCAGICPDGRTVLDVRSLLAGSEFAPTAFAGQTS